MYSKIEKMRELNRPPVPRHRVKDIKEDPLSKRLRRLDNAEILRPVITDMIYINTNENNVEKTFQSLSTIPMILQGGHIGFSGLCNFAIIAKRKSSRAVICDKNPENALFLYHVLRILRASRDPHHFINTLTDYIKDVDANELNHCLELTPELINFGPNLSDNKLYQNLSGPADEIALELRRKFSWLSSPESYNHLKNLAMQDKIAVITLDICATETLKKVYELLKDNNIQVDTLYISNISDWMEKDTDKVAFTQTVKTLLSDNDTILIDAPQNNQRVTQAKEINNVNLNDWLFPSNVNKKQSSDDKNFWCNFFKKAALTAGVSVIAGGLYIVANSNM